MRRLVIIASALALAAGGCGGDEDEGGDAAAPPPAPSTTTAPAEPAAPETEAPEPNKPSASEPSYERTPQSLRKCIAAAPGVADVIVKGRENEDAAFFADLVGGRVDVLGVTLRGQAAELSVFLFASEAGARKAEPSAGGGGVSAQTQGSAVLAGPPRADMAGVVDCLRKTGYA